MKRSSGFTIVELAVVIVVLAILVTVTVVSFGRVQSDARNTSSDAKGVAIAEGLERYYEANGEYPSCALVTQANTTTVTSTVLKGLDPNTLTRAGAASGTNSIDCNAPDTTNFAYSGNSSGYTLSYREERTGQVVTFTSKHQAAVETTAKPTIAVAFSGGNVVATANTTTTCTNSQTLYSFKHKLNNNAWTSYGAASTSNTASQPATPGYQYAYQVMAQCSASPTIAESDISSTIIYPVPTPAAPSLTVNISGSNVVAALAAPSCPASTTPRNSIQWIDTATAAGGTWTAWAAWNPSSTFNNSHAINQGARSTYRGQAYCDGLFADSATVQTATVSAIRPIATPATPVWNSQYNYFYSCDGGCWRNNVSFTTACPAGTWLNSTSFDSHPEWKPAETWWHPWVYSDWWYTASASNQYVNYYARYTCATDFASATSADGYYRVVVYP